MSFQLDTSTHGAEIRNVYEKVLSGADDCSWAIFGYEKGQGNILKVVASGNDNDEFLDEFDENAVLFGFLRVKDVNTGLNKFVLVCWCGEAAARKGLFSIHMATVSNLLKGYHVQITGRESSDLNMDDIIRRVADASGSKYSVHTSNSTPQSKHNAFYDASQTFGSTAKVAPAPAPSTKTPLANISKPVVQAQKDSKDNSWDDSSKQSNTQTANTTSNLRVPVNASWSDAGRKEKSQENKPKPTPFGSGGPSKPTPFESHGPAKQISVQPSEHPKPSISTTTTGSSYRSAESSHAPTTPDHFKLTPLTKLEPQPPSGSPSKKPVSELEELHTAGNVNLSARRALFEKKESSTKNVENPVSHHLKSPVRTSFPPASTTASKQDSPSTVPVDKQETAKPINKQVSSNETSAQEEPRESVAALRARFAKANVSENNDPPTFPKTAAKISSFNSKAGTSFAKPRPFTNNPNPISAPEKPTSGESLSLNPPPAMPKVFPERDISSASQKAAQPSVITPSVPQPPAAPVVPEAPSVHQPPAAPVAPEVPSAPQRPAAPVVPEAPSVPQRPAVPVVPEALSVPQPPVAPVAPEVPSVPQPPVAPVVPEAPSVPQPPVAPVAPEVPSVPQRPAVPVVPEAPSVPQPPAAPVVPEVPSVPQRPAVPVVPEAPSVPQPPAAPVVPEVPSVPQPPAVPVVPEAGQLNEPVVPPLPPHDETQEPQVGGDVKATEHTQPTKTPAIVIYDYSPEEENEIELVENEQIQILEFVDDGWWLGENSKGQQGLFPSNYVEITGPNETANNPPAEPQAGGPGKSVKAIYDYQAQEDNELSFFEDEIIANVDCVDPNWWEGECHGHRGLFPSNYVEEI
ncbi:Protein app1 [Schizosaccharomyces pombe]|uniref:Protein app1 n=1 Tax=Schizosaccharomyces pombe (strain 972 / ATCC 24843) TaxID=284812 RepID=APP1_SCHPO|nr:cofilin/tropomyosin family protein abp1 [Schizosaccharomyces pombe]Q9P7E8.1 RecName: Full=Protein app1 [Schizosaccharomyces pombe 972h-]CAB83085.1 cofilin/tropomyosin family, drebrin ortholog Abp1 [Schizosaccharomyces pombe]|eukprot:NP_594921.1 cofilin/tropomyosin family protein abp1 [Schizosaccharomyces pombe]